MKLLPIPTGEGPFKEMAMEFVRELPKSGGYSAIVVIADEFTKVQRYMLVKTTWTAEDVANSSINDIWKLFVPLRDITSDWDLQFSFKFVKELN